MSGLYLPPTNTKQLFQPTETTCEKKRMSVSDKNEIIVPRKGLNVSYANGHRGFLSTPKFMLSKKEKPHRHSTSWGCGYVAEFFTYQTMQLNLEHLGRASGARGVAPPRGERGLKSETPSLWEAHHDVAPPRGERGLK